MTTTQRTRIINRINIITPQLDKLYATYGKMIESGVSSYKFDSGEGSQSTSYRSLKEVSAEISRLEAELDALYRKLNSEGIVNLNMRRNPGGC